MRVIVIAFTVGTAWASLHWKQVALAETVLAIKSELSKHEDANRDMEILIRLERMDERVKSIQERMVVRNQP